MGAKGRPRLTSEQYQARLDDYCQRYKITRSEDGLPPFPAGRRETPQHREWIALYSAHRRLALREPALVDEAIRENLRRQDGACPICGETVDLSDALDRDRSGRSRGLLHAPCQKLVRLAEAAGPAAVDALRAYLWPGASRRTKR